MFKAIIKYWHNIIFGNTGTQQHYQWPKHFNLKIEEGFFVSFNTIYAPAPSMLKKNKPTTNVCKKLFWQHWGPAAW